MSSRAATQIAAPAKTDWPEIEKTLAAMVAAGCVEVHEDGHWLADLSDLHYELKCDGKNSLVHLWSDERNLVRRILRVLESSPQRIVFEVRRFGRNRASLLEFLCTG